MLQVSNYFDLVCPRVPVLSPSTKFSREPVAARGNRPQHRFVDRPPPWGITVRKPSVQLWALSLNSQCKKRSP